MHKLKIIAIVKLFLSERRESDKMADVEQSQNKREDRNVNINQNSPEILTNNIYTPAFLREQIGRLTRVEFLIGTNNLTDRIGILEDVGASYILLRSIESNNLVYCDIYSIKFVTIADRNIGMANTGMMNMGMNNMNMTNLGMINPTMMSNRYYQ